MNPHSHANTTQRNDHLRQVPTPLAITLALLCLLASSPLLGATERDVRKKMGSRFEITAVHVSSSVAKTAISAAYDEIDRLEALISSWDEASQTSEIIRQAGIAPVVVDQDLFGLISRALKIARLTNGAYDISFAAAGNLWNFKTTVPTLPEPAALAEVLSLVDYRLITLDSKDHSVFLQEKGMRIGFGGIGKGFAANRAMKILKEHGITSGVVNAGGDLLAFGKQEDGKPWTVGIADPKRRDQVFAQLAIENQAVVTSGDYESFFRIDGKRYAHILDPRTGYPVEGLLSVTIVCPDAELADALATATFVLGPTKGLELINRIAHVEGLMVTSEGDMLFSKNLESSFTRPLEPYPSN